MAEDPVVVAQVVLKGRGGTSVLDAGGPVTAAVIDRYRADDEVVREAARRLSALGFAVSQPGPTSITVSASRQRFEQVFGTTLEEQRQEGSEGSQAGTWYRAVAPATIPEELATTVAGVILPVPPELFP